ncbi:MAG: MiaB/RimO family radical SAM methylthiotransferase [Spirochaetales bacterium]
MKYYILNLGCQMNQADSERIQSVLETMGLQKTDDEAQASVLGLVACSVRQKAIDRVHTKIHEWNERKAQENVVTFLSGCVLPADEDAFLKKFDLMFSIADLGKLPELLRGHGIVTPLSQTLPAGNGLDHFWNVVPQYSSTFEAYVPIQNGCDKFCTFCAVPYTRGREVSRPSAAILQEVRDLVDKGFKSITLLGQNVNSYGLDKPGEELSFVNLLTQIGEYGRSTGREFWVYFTSPHPRDMGTDILEAIRDFPVLAKHIHLPLQSGDDKVLIRMNRNHSMDRYRSLVGTLRELLPEATLVTDIIVGFTGESVEQFENTRLAMREFGYQMAFVAAYSPRPGAASARWNDDVPLGEKKRRLQVLTEELHLSSLEFNRKLLGRNLRVLVERQDKKAGYLAARTEGKIPIRFASSDLSLIGSFVSVVVESVVPLSIEGRLV